MHQLPKLPPHRQVNSRTSLMFRPEPRFAVQASRVQGLKFRAWSFGFRVKGLGGFTRTPQLAQVPLNTALMVLTTDISVE